MKLLWRYPVLTVGILQAVLAVGVAFGLGLDAGQVAAICGLAGAVLAMLAGVHQVVSSPETVLHAVTNAASQTAAQLSGLTVGAAGEVTEAASNIVTGVVSDVVGTIGGLVPALTLKGTTP